MGKPSGKLELLEETLDDVLSELEELEELVELEGPEEVDDDPPQACNSKIAVSNQIVFFIIKSFLLDFNPQRLNQTAMPDV